MSKLYINGSGCYDPTAFNAISHADNNILNIDKEKDFIRDIFKVCRTYNIVIDGDINIYDRDTGKDLKTIRIYKRKEKGEESGESNRQ